MALGIHKESIFTVYQFSFFPMEDENWIDNDWLVGHLRLLADTIEESKIRIHNVTLELDRIYKTPRIQVYGTLEDKSVNLNNDEEDD